MTPKINRFLAERQPETPCLVVDLDVISANFGALRSALPQAEIYYAVKANPASPVLQRLAGLGSNFDAASLSEIERCLAAGADPSGIAFGNTAKKLDHIAAAYSRGVRLFAFDSEPELEKLAQAAPGSEVFCRMLVAGEGAAWPLSHKFGCSAEMAVDLMVKARDAGLAAAAGRVGQVLLEQAPAVRTVRIPRNAELAVMFAERLERGRVRPAEPAPGPRRPAPPPVERVEAPAAERGEVR